MRSYRCFLSRNNAICETGVREYVQLRARSAEHAARLAIAATGAQTVVDVQRIEESNHG